MQTLSTLAYGTAPVLSPGLRCNSSAFGLGTCSTGIGATTAAGPAASDSNPAARVEGVLGRWGVSSYLCGHLHDMFGYRLHRLHPKPQDAGMRVRDWTAICACVLLQPMPMECVNQLCTVQANKRCWAEQPT